MIRVLRLLLIGLMMLTLPVQGVSAAVMAMRMEMPSHAPEGPAMAHCPDMAMHLDAADHATMPSLQDHHPASLPAGKLKPCSLCCVGAMLDTSAAPLIAAAPQGSGYTPQLSLAPKGIVPKGLERPPRALS